jgi:putative peptidoglycan lipid II flippase
MVTVSFSSRFAAGSIGAMRMADRTWQMPYGIIAQSIGIALLPNLSGKYANSDIEGYKKTLDAGLRYVLLLAIPVFAACLALSDLIMRTLFLNSDRLTETDIALTASILICYSSALVTQSVNTILTRAFYACNETKTPMLTGIFIIGINILLSILFYNFTPIGVRGMALAYAVSSLVNLVLLVFLLNRKIPGLKVFGGLRVYFVKTGGAALIMAVLLVLAGRLLPSGFLTGPFGLGLKIRQLLTLGANAAAGALVYFGLLAAFGLPEVSAITGNIKNRIIKPRDRGGNIAGGDGG